MKKKQEMSYLEFDSLFNGSRVEYHLTTLSKLNRVHELLNSEREVQNWSYSTFLFNLHSLCWKDRIQRFVQKTQIP